MISERKLVASHSSFWRNAMPMGETFVRGMNVNLDRFALPRSSTFKGPRNALISELSFRLYSEHLAGDLSLKKDSKSLNRARLLSDDVCAYIARLDRASSVTSMEDAEIGEAFEWAMRLNDYMNLGRAGIEVVTRPQFTGCGLLDNCEGDLLAGAMLYELKNVERDFRLADIRQLLCYCALNSVSGQHRIDMVALINARLGLSFQIGLNELCLAVSGMPAADLLADVINYVSTDRPSR